MFLPPVKCMPLAYHCAHPYALKDQKFLSDLSVHKGARSGISYRHLFTGIYLQAGFR